MLFLSSGTFPIHMTVRCLRIVEGARGCARTAKNIHAHCTQHNLRKINLTSKCHVNTHSTKHKFIFTSCISLSTSSHVPLAVVCVGSIFTLQHTSTMRLLFAQNIFIFFFRNNHAEYI